MEIQPADIIDRMTIVKLKIERIGDPALNAEMEALSKAVEEFKEKGIEIKQDWIDELYRVNGDEWDLLDKMNKERQEGKDYAKIGQLYLETEQINKNRAEVKNRIVEETGKGFKEIKKDHPSA
jgi:hypothetical protein